MLGSVSIPRADPLPEPPEPAGALGVPDDVPWGLEPTAEPVVPTPLPVDPEGLRRRMVDEPEP